jgi:hypothetical protein
VPEASTRWHSDDALGAGDDGGGDGTVGDGTVGDGTVGDGTVGDGTVGEDGGSGGGDGTVGGGGVVVVGGVVVAGGGTAVSVSMAFNQNGSARPAARPMSRTGTSHHAGTRADGSGSELRIGPSRW